MSKHTPGPWQLKAHPDPCYSYISAPEYFGLAEVVCRVEEEDRSPECEANAHLIAAAPEMLEALEMMLGILTVAGIAADTEAMQHLQSVIAKATGVLAEGDSKGE